LAPWAKETGERIMQCKIFQNQSDKMPGNPSDKMMAKSIIHTSTFALYSYGFAAVV